MQKVSQRFTLITIPNRFQLNNNTKHTHINNFTCKQREDINRHQHIHHRDESINYVFILINICEYLQI